MGKLGILRVEHSALSNGRQREQQERMEVLQYAPLGNAVDPVKWHTRPIPGQSDCLRPNLWPHKSSTEKPTVQM